MVNLARDAGRVAGRTELLLERLASRAGPLAEVSAETAALDRIRDQDLLEAVTFADVRASDRYIVVVIEATGPDEHDIGMVTGPAGLTDPRGAHVPNMHGAGLPAGSTTGGLRERQELYWPRQGSGTYHLVVGPYQGQRLDRDLVIE